MNEIKRQGPLTLLETRPKYDYITNVFRGNYTEQVSITKKAIAAALTVLKHGRLHRYNEAEGEVAESALLELEFAAQMGSRYCLAVASGGYALATALRAVGVKPGDKF